MTYNVSDVQLYQSGGALQGPNDAWLSADDDSDGVTNGSEIAAGTNPFDATKAVRINSIVKNGNNLEITFPTVRGKRYVIQSTMTLDSPLSWDPAGAEVIGTSSPTQMLPVPLFPDKFYRVLVQDVDSDNDGASDWAEWAAGGPNAGFDPNNSADGAALASAILTSDRVTVSVTKANATQPLAGFAPVETGSITVSRGGPLKIHTITVPLQKSGTATAGTDYDALPASVIMPPGVGDVVLTVNPKANSNRKTNVTVIVKALAGPGYSLAGTTSGSVVINPAGIANGTGLSAVYHNQASFASYAAQLAIFDAPAGPVNGGPEMTRTDATVDFSNNTGGNGWGTTAGPTGMSPVSTTGAFSARWTGQILPQYSETYTIDFRSDDGARVWVNGQLLIDRWLTQSAQDYVNTIPLQAGVFYDIQIDYGNSSGSAEARLYWWSASQPKQIIPQNRLFPAPAQASKATAITSSLAAVGYEGTPFAFDVVSSNIGGAGTTYALAPNSGTLPPGLILNTITGAITGTPTLAGIYNVAVDATNVAAAAVTGSSIVNITIYPVGGVSRETLAANGTATADGKIASFDDDTDYPNNTSRRLRGYLIPPKTGNYYVWIAANNTAELWIANDSEFVNRVKRASIAGGSGKKTWNASPTQQSPWMTLEAGEKYYIEVLHNTGTDLDDHVAVGWCQDDIGTVPAAVGAPNATGAATLLTNGAGGLQGYPLSGPAPGYVFQPYDYPVVTPPSGTLYACNLGPQTSAITSASGSANIQINAAKTEAILHFKYQNLGTPKTGYHLHVDGYTSSAALGSTIHSNGEIIYDIDDADALPALQTADGGYIWDLTTPVGSFGSNAQLVEAIETGKVYLNVHSVGYPNGEIRGTFGVIDGSQTPPDGTQYAPRSVTDVASNPAHAARFLNQATFGASPTDVSYVQTNGFQAWISDQLTKPASRTSNDVVAGLTADINLPYPSTLFTDTWWKYTITAQDQLRQRLAFALSEIMVVSWANNTGPLQNNGRILADYYDQLVDYCLPTSGLTDSGKFRGLLKAVTLTPAMGLYLDMRANQKGDDTVGRHPNENYAREIMQLFSIGIYRMWDDGKFVLGSDAGLVSTYTQPNIIGLANLFTGWNYAQPNQASGRLPTNFGPAADYLNPMVLVPTQHELGSKLLLNNVASPAATGRTPRVVLASVLTGTPCTVNTATIHGLKVGDTVMISSVGGGSFSPTTINASHRVTEIVDADSFKVAIDCSVLPTSYTNATVTGAKIIPPAIAGTGGISAVAGSQADNSGSTVPHPYDQYGLIELDRAIDNIVNNDNVPPYICRQLIQRLVTSDPSPGYIYRVVQKFRDNGSGVRGDLAAVVSQIMLDGEARGNPPVPAAFGKQREPMLRLTGAARAFPSTAYTGTYTQLTGTSSNKLRIVTSAPNDFSTSFNVSLDFRGNYSPAGQTLLPLGTVPTSTTYGVTATLAIAATHTDVASIPISTPCLINTVQPHGLSNGATVIISGVTGGTFTAPITTARVIANVTATSFTLTGVNCTAEPTGFASARMVSNPCRVTTKLPHGLSTNDSVTISGVSAGTFNPTINGTFPVTFVDSTSFTIPSNCTVSSTINTGSIVGANTLEVTATGMVNVTYTQAAGSPTMAVNTSGPATSVTVPGTGGATIIKSKVYLAVLSRAAALPLTSIAIGNPCTITAVNHGLVSGDTVTISGVTGGTFTGGLTTINKTHTVTFDSADTFTVLADCTGVPTTAGTATGSFGPTAADGVYQVDSNGSNLFTVTTADTPTATRTGSVLIPKIATSYTPQTSNTIVQYNTNVNHNLAVGHQIWVDVPVIGSPVADAEYTVTTITDEDHFRTSYLPTNVNGGTYPKPSGSTNSVTIWPLVPAPLGRSGVVTINQSTFNLGSTESTLTQSPLNAPTVFNYFFPDYKFPGSLANNGLDSPEFQLTTDTNVMNLTNTLTNMFIGTGGGNGNLNGLTSFNNGGGSVVMDIGSYIETTDDLSNGAIPALVDQLSYLLVGAPLELNTKNTIVNFVANTTNFPLTGGGTNLQKRDRVRAIIHLIITSAEYAVQK